jgi:hypothetical protein
MLLPVIIFVIVLSPVLVPATITAVHAIARWQRTYRPAQAASYPRRMPSRRLAVAAE